MERALRWMLLVDTCGSEGGVGLAELREEGAILLAERTLPGRETQENLLRALSALLLDASIPLSTVDVLAVVSGPGSFTGVRVGLASVKALGEALGRPVVALSRLAVLAAQARAMPGEIVQAWIDAGRGDVFVGRYRDGDCLNEQMLHGADAVAASQRSGERVVVMEEGAAMHIASAEKVAAPGVRQALALAAAAAMRRDFADTALLDANYLRVPDAELARRAREQPVAAADAAPPAYAPSRPASAGC